MMNVATGHKKAPPGATEVNPRKRPNNCLIPLLVKHFMQLKWRHKKAPPSAAPGEASHRQRAGAVS
jgi:hypothetical protein